MRLVDYDEMRKLFDKEYKRIAQLIREGETHLDNLAEGFTQADRVIWRLPDVDAVEVVRCKDCIHYYELEPVCLKIYSDGNVSSDAWQERKPDDFCSYGERKDDADNER